MNVDILGMSKLKWTGMGEKVRLVKAMVFPVVMYGCESWTVKKVEHQRIHAFATGNNPRLALGFMHLPDPSRSGSVGRQPWALSLPDKELCLREALAVCTPPAPEPSAKRPGS